ncbi:serine hydrolase domain-containing protein [Streptomyces sp. NBC_01497]|uniref:serine hydrolase domain-containing protein n=1 Tax=Streptomyces sp. NBC_01497 TaxID=2903885 RepID=UPI002E32FAA7|nr:serine hydrolase domain-containing protein [Streptomyces sp. NBC_01497]
MSAPYDTPRPARPAAAADRGATGGGTSAVDALTAALDEAVRAVDAPDVVFACARRGRRAIRCGGTAPAPPTPRELLRYETGSASKPYTGLLLGRLLSEGAVGAGDPAQAYLAPGRRPGPHPLTLTHLITHTSGLPSLPADLYPGALRQWRSNPYAHYPAERVVRAFLGARPRHRPGTRWHYSNFGVAALGHALAAATGTPWESLLTDGVLAPLGLTATALSPAAPGAGPVDATGHRADGRTATPPLLIGGFQAAGAVRATPGDLLAFVEAHLRPAGSPLEDALLAMRRDVLARGRGHRDVHTLTWFRHESEHGPVYFHAGATSGQQAFLGFAPGTDTALAAVATRRFRLRDTFVATAYALLQAPPGDA